MHVAADPCPVARSGFWPRLRHVVCEADYCASWNRYLPWRNALGCLLLIAGAAAVAGLTLHEQSLVLAACVVGVIVLGLVWPWVSLRGLSGRVAFDCRRTSEGDVVQLRLWLTNRWPLAAWGLRVVGGFAQEKPAASDLQAVAGLAVVPGWRTTEFVWTFTPSQRGEYPFTTPRLVTGFPFGLWEASRPLSVERTLLVWPRTFHVELLPEAAAHDRTREGSVPIDKAGTSGDILGLRPYRQGDSLRRVHWAQSARHDRLIICEQQTTAFPRVQIVLDADPAVHAGTGPDSSREWAIRIAATIAETATRHSAQVECVLGKNRTVTALGKAQLPLILDALARLPDAPDGSLADLLDLPACARWADGLQIIVTTDVPALAHFKHAVGGRCVVLRRGAFAGPGMAAHVAQPHARGCILIDSPTDVPEQFRAGWKELLGAA